MYSLLQREGFFNHSIEGKQFFIITKRRIFNHSIEINQINHVIKSNKRILLFLIENGFSLIIFGAI